ncbi:diacylglycerol/lipid kinase family protein [Mammaliicoccus vitulinus]|uniref:Diacylglycerol kinase family lipid kinase n=2 Tax=Mammaliicoccus vitulinus TaxID=71237 RepID=A0A2T4PRE1_9STAP|nr:diacylglycerol kinase family protein [Mammaliicoccus vitulinus]PTI28658.1 diacylglycerol kinase family lipid kinase [Mammaliicoccus vitulinus]PTI71242.1 diacylglycerol kinase family lipid kinase [Mammaliicoccus vitulinus]PTI87449.1 diacylglycerol kinase family lipid kinase [Mammaliicoccus vitulinus]QQT16113.1 diacylglycerol kinase family lipid kinase [Mammaliicoccus vitulinus]QQY18589.1 diacylglycerol kinase family lipid kinase [Mammaliicoccus vitulinus]
MTQHFHKGILFYHKAAGQGNIYKELGQVTENLTQLCDDLTIKLSKEEGQIKSYCKEIAENNHVSSFDVFFILGGDGTLNELINGVVENNLQIPIGVLPGGTFNDFTKTLNLSQKPMQASQDLLNSQIKSFDVLDVNGTYALNFAGIGLMVQNAENVESNQKELFGKFSYVFSTIKTVSNPEIYNYRLIADGKEYSGETSMILVANGQNVGGSKIPLEDLSPNDGKMNIFIFDRQNFSIINDFFKVKDSMNWNEISESITHISCESASLETDPHAKLDIDGEILFETPVDIKLLKDQVKLLYLDINNQ